MPRKNYHRADLWISLFLALAVASCRPQRSPGSQSTGGAMTGGNTAIGGNTVTGGETAIGGNTAIGGDTAAGGNTATGGDTATGGNTESSSSSTQNCGTPGLPCCSSDPACTDSDSQCFNEFCAKCGVLGERCCPGNSCTAGCCSGDTCVANPSGGECPIPPPADAGNISDVAQEGCTTATATPCTGLPAYTGNQVLDGNDDDFCNVPSFELNFTNATSTGGRVKVYNTGATSYPERAIARVAWDSAGIHAFIRVIDPKFVPATDVSTIYNSDAIELLFTSTTSGLSGGTAQDSGVAMHVIVSPPLAAKSQATGSNGSQIPLDPSLFKAATEDGGYKVELKLPWPGQPPTAGSQIKFDMELNSADGNTTPGDAGPRDAQAILYQGTDPGGSPCGGELFPYCDDRLWCSTTLQ